MKQQEFINVLYEAGWDNKNDTQHTKIKTLYKQMLSIIAELEEYPDE